MSSAQDFAAAFRYQTWRVQLAEPPPQFENARAGVLRAALGPRLLSAVCPYEAPRCTECDLRTTCPWPTTFRPIEREGVAANPPAPYTLSWDHPDGPRLTLIGTATNHTAIWLKALRATIAGGLGKQRQRLTIQGCDPIPEPTPPEIEGAHLGLRFRTPTQLRRKGSTLQRFDLPFFLDRGLARLEELARHYQDGYTASEGKSPLIAEHPVHLVEDHTETATMTRYSQKQKNTIVATGFVGDIIIAGAWRPLLPLLLLLTRVGAGRGATATWGGGRFELFDPESSAPLPNSDARKATLS